MDPKGSYASQSSIEQRGHAVMKERPTEHVYAHDPDGDAVDLVLKHHGTAHQSIEIVHQRNGSCGASGAPFSGRR